MQIKDITLSLIFSLLSTILFAQTGTIRGFVYDNNTREPIIFTNVIIKGTTTGAATDVNGYFSIPNVDAGNYTLETVYLGYENNEMPVTVADGKIADVKIYLKEANIELDAVQISAKKQALKKNVQISSVKLTNEDITRLPSMGGEADIAQYLQVVPGVVFSGEQGGQLYVRGGAPIQNKILLDGMPIYNAFHSIGVFSVFETDLIRNVDVITGGFNSEYGGRLSAVVDITTKSGNKKEMERKISVNPFMMKAILQGPIIGIDQDKGGTASYVFTAKHSIIDQTSKSLYSNVDSLPFDFTDVYGKISFDSETGSNFNLFGFRFNDGVNFQNSNLGWTNFGIGVKSMIVPQSSPTLIEWGGSYSKYSILLNEYNEFARSSDIAGQNFFFNFKYYVGDDDEIKYGFEVLRESADFRFLNSFDNEISESSNTIDLGAFFKYKLIVEKDLILEPNVRIQRYNALRINSLEPRFGMKYNASNNLRFKFATGLYSQSLISAVSDQDVVNLFTGFIFAPAERLTDLTGELAKNSLQKSAHVVGGFELDFLKYFELNIETYYKDYGQLININRNKMFASDPNFMIETGSAYGVDFLLNYDYKRFYFWGTYSLAFTHRNMLDDQDKLVKYYPHFDRRHNLNLLGSYVFGKEKNWEMGAKWNLGTGFPFTQVSSFYEKPVIENVSDDFLSANGDIGIHYGEINQGRLHTFHRLDVTLKKFWQIGEDSRLESNFTLTNAYDRQNIFYMDRLTNQRVNQLPMIPSIGASLTF